MLDPASLSIIVLVGLFAAAMWDRVNLGLLCFPAAFLVAAADGISADEVTGFFPSSFVVLVLGVTSLFAVAQNNGTLPWLLDGALRLVGGRLALIPWLTFLVGALIAGLGTLPAAATAMLAPIAMGFAVRYGFPYLLMVVSAGIGIIAGCFSPIAVYGLTALNLYEEGGVDTPAGTNAIIFVATLVLGLLMMLACTVIASRFRRREPHAPRPDASESSGVVDGSTGETGRGGAGGGETRDQMRRRRREVAHRPRRSWLRHRRRRWMSRAVSGTGRSPWWHSAFCWSRRWASTSTWATWPSPWQLSCS